MFTKHLFFFLPSLTFVFTMNSSWLYVPFSSKMSTCTSHYSRIYLYTFMKNLFVLAILMACSGITWSQATASTSQTVAISNASKLQLNLFSSDIEVREIKGSRLIVESHITVEGVTNSTILEYIIQAGRYELSSQTDASTQTLTLTRKMSDKVLMVKGQACSEHVRYIVLVPNSIKIVETKSTKIPLE